MEKENINNLIEQFTARFKGTDEETATAAEASAVAATASTSIDPTQLKESKTFNLAGGAICTVDLSECTARIENSDIGADETLLGIGISHVFGANVGTSFYGKNCGLSVYEKLDFSNAEAGPIATPVYTDATGNTYKFTVLYYCYEDEEKKYFSEAGKKNITGTAGNLKYGDTTVYFEYMHVGSLIYETDYSPVNQEGAVRWIKTGNLHKGFNSSGRLAVIKDDFEKYIIFDYVNDRPVKIRDKNENYIALSFGENNNGNLQEITDSRGRKRTYAYENGQLKSIKYFSANGTNYKSIELNYIYIGSVYCLNSISCSDTSRTAIEYSQYASHEYAPKTPYLIRKLTHYSKMDSAAEGEISTISFEYDKPARETVISDEYYNSEKYVFDKDGNTKTYTRTFIGKVIYKETCDYKPYEYRNTEVTDSSGNVTKTLITLDGRNLPVLVTQTNVPLTEGYYKTVKTINIYSDDYLLIQTVTEEEYSYGYKSKSVVFYTYDSNTNLLKKKQEDLYGFDNKVAMMVLERTFTEEYTYDKSGNITKTSREIVNSNRSDREKYNLHTDYNSNKQPYKVYDESGLNATTYVYKENTNLAKSVTSPENGKLSFTYDDSDRVISVYGYDVGTNINDITYINGEIKSTSATNGANKIEYTYDYKHRPLTVKLNGGSNNYETYTYSDNVTDTDGNKYDKVTFKNANGETFTAKSFRNGTKEELYKGESELMLIRNYNADGTLSSIVDKTTNTTTAITYDKSGAVTKYSEGGNTEMYTYDKRGRISKVAHTGGVVRDDIYEYNRTAVGEIKTVTTGSFISSPLQTIDGRYKGKEIKTGNTVIDSESVEYYKNGENSTHRPIKITYKDGTKIEYVYDGNGNILEIEKNGSIIARYMYDSFNRLIREDNAELGYTHGYMYDLNGNITTKGVWEYTLDGLSQYTLKEIYDFIYDVNGKFLRMTETFNSEMTETITYDNIGNPLTWEMGAMTWEKGRRLVKYGNNTYKYDAQGRRTQKNYITFTYDSRGRIIKQSDGLEFFYDTTGLVGLKYNNVNYTYRKDIQGNIIAILDNSGNVVVEYSYDAWGNHKISGSNTTLGNKNPFRYRGYYYDTETALYYLQTRYYDSYIGRFINIDCIDYADPTYLNGLNLYAYCNNNPVMNVDPTGEFFILALIFVATTVTGAIIGGKIAADEGKEGLDLVGAIFLGAAMGLAVGGAAVALTGVVAGAIAGVSTMVLGVTAAQAFAIGATVFNVTAVAIAPLYGITMQPIDYETPKPLPLPTKPQPTPPHPYNNRRSFYDRILRSAF